MTDLPMFVPPGGIDPTSRVGTTGATFKAIAAQQSAILPGLTIGDDPGRNFYMGVNFSGQEYVDADNNTDLPQFPNESYFAYYASRGVHFIRFTGLWEHFQPVLFQDFRQDYLAKWEQCIELAAKYGIAVLADPFHNYGTRLVDGVAHYLGDGVLTKEAFADSWKRFVTYFSRHSNIFGWDLMGEPSSTDGKLDGPTWADCAQAAITAIREVDTVRQIHVEGFAWSSSFYWESNNPTIHKLVDPNDNMVFSAHCYLDRNASGGWYYWDEEVAAGDQFSYFTTMDDTIGVKRLKPFVDWLQKYNLRGAIGEIGTGRYDNKAGTKSVGWTSALDKALSYLRYHKIPAFYWASGPYGNLSGKDNNGQTWTDQQPGTLDPVGSTWYAGVDPYGEETPQMAVVRKFASHPPTILTYQATASKNTDGTYSIIVQSKDLVETPFKIMLTDNGSGGIIRGGRVLDVPPGPGFYAEVIYVPPSTQEACAINFTNTGGLIDPTPVVLAGLTNPLSLYNYNALAVVWPRKLVSTYTGPVFTLMKSDGTETKDIAFSGNGSLPDYTPLGDWDTGTPTVKTFYDQSGNGADFGPIVTTNNSWSVTPNTPVPPAISDYPVFGKEFDTQLPYLRFGGGVGDTTTGHRMDAHIPINGLQEFTLFIAVRPRSPFAENTDNFLQWNLTEIVTVGDNTGGWSISGDDPKDTHIGFNCNELALYTIRFSSGVKTTYLNGVKVATAQSNSDTLVSEWNDVCNVGWYRWYKSTTKLDLFGVVAIASHMEDSDLDAWHRSLMADLSLAKPEATSYQLTADMIGFGDTDVSTALASIEHDASMPKSYSIQIIPTENYPQVKIIVPGPVSKPFEILLSDSVGGWFEGGSSVRIPASTTTTYVTKIYHPPAYYCSVWLTPSNTGGIKDPDPQIVRFSVDIFTNNGTTPLCVLWPRKLIPGYSGAALTLMASDGKTVHDLPYDSITGIASVAQAQAFDPNATVQYLHDQTSMFPMGPIASSNTWSTDQTAVPTLKSDYPTFITASGCALPALRFNGDNRMDVKLPIDGRNKLTLFVLVKTSDAWNDTDSILGWYLQNRLRVLHGADRDITSYDATAKVTKVYDSGWKASDGFQLYTFEYNAGSVNTTKGLTDITTGVDSGSTTLADPFNEYMNVGWDRWYKSSSKFSLVGIVAIADVLSETVRNRIATSLLVDAGVSLPSVFVPIDMTARTSAEIGYKNITLEKAVHELTALTKFHAQILKARVNFYATYSVQSNEILGAFVADLAMTWDTNFAGSVGTVKTPPTNPYTFTIKLNQTGIGWIFVDTLGNVSFKSDPKVTPLINVGDTVTVVGSAVADSVMNNFFCNLLLTPYAPDLAYPE